MNQKLVNGFLLVGIGLINLNFVNLNSGYRYWFIIIFSFLAIFLGIGEIVDSFRKRKKP